MRVTPAVNSRDYIVALELRSKDDCPADFVLPPSLAGFDAGLFLPRGDSDWFGRPSYPPRILLLAGAALHIIPHPSAGEPPRQCALEQISSVESGHMLLKGWLRFTGPAFDHTIRYNTRGIPTVLRFMRRFRGQWLRGAEPCATPEIHPGAAPDIKFGNALARELDSGETVLMQFFRPPSEVKSRTWWLPRRRWMAGDLLALTARRLLWITDRERGCYSPYGSIASYAPLDAVLRIGLTSGRGGDILQVNLNNGPVWQFPMASECRGVAEDFAAALENRKGRNETSRTEARR
jgi:hypothetical protein